ncbi:DUF1326 domain-containing protein [Arthrobacter sp. LjRoot14]|uniref:DUF1326 domain-containing protein n=1 Tax=Arthrobacter sp. LjRoot14 TaxID=3342265 RepID=UPI003ECCAC1C
MNVFHIASGKLDDTDLSGVDFAFANWFPSHLAAGEWKVGAVVDDAASDAQVRALGSIFRGVYGETSDFSFASEMAEGAPKGRG